MYDGKHVYKKENSKPQIQGRDFTRHLEKLRKARDPIIAR